MMYKPEHLFSDLG